MANQLDDPNVSSTSETPDPDPVTDDSQEDAVVNRLQRVFAVFMSPADAMRGVKINGGWIHPLWVFLLCTAIYVIAAGPYMAEMQIDQVRNQMQERVSQGQMSQEQADRAIETSAQFQEGPVGIAFMGVGTAIGVFVFSLIAAALLLLVGNVIHNGSEKFAKYWSLIWYAGVLSSLNLLIMGVLIRVTQDPNGGHLGLALLTKADPSAAIHQVASLVNIFSVWEAFVVGIGLSIFAKISRGLGIVYAFLIIIVLPALIVYGIGSIFGTFGG